MALLTAHNTELYEIGGGILYVAPWEGTTPPEEEDYVDVGNCPSFSYELKVDKLEHKSSRGQTRVVDKRVIIETGYTLKFQLDEPSAANFARWCKGELEGSVVHGLVAPLQEFAVRLVTDNYTGENKIYDFWRCELGGTGGINLIDLEKFKTMDFEGMGLDDSDNHADSPLYDVTFVEITA
jgi:hypothetical protein